MKKILPYILLLSLFGCQYNTENIGIKIIPENDTLRLSSLYNSCKISKLTDISLSKISKITILDSLIIILGQANQGDLHLFNSNGEYKKTIFNKHDNLFQINNIQDFDVFSNEIYFLADMGRQLFTYNLTNYKTDRIAKIPIQIGAIEKFIVLDSSRIIFYNDLPNSKHEEYKLYIYNHKQDSIEKQFSPMDKELAYILSISQKNNLYRQDGKICLYETFSDKIIELKDDSIVTQLTFDNGKYSFPKKHLKTKIKNINELVDFCKQNNYIWAHTDLFENNKYIISSYEYKNNVYMNVINKSTMIARSYRYIYDDISTMNVYAVTDFSITLLNNSVCIFLLEPYVYIDTNETNDNTNKSLDVKYTDNTLLFTLS